MIGGPAFWFSTPIVSSFRSDHLQTSFRHRSSFSPVSSELTTKARFEPGGDNVAKIISATVCCCQHHLICRAHCCTFRARSLRSGKIVDRFLGPLCPRRE